MSLFRQIKVHTLTFVDACADPTYDVYMAEQDGVFVITAVKGDKLYLLEWW